MNVSYKQAIISFLTAIVVALSSTAMPLQAQLFYPDTTFQPETEKTLSPFARDAIIIGGVFAATAIVYGIISLAKREKGHRGKRGVPGGGVLPSTNELGFQTTALFGNSVTAANLSLSVTFPDGTTQSVESVNYDSSSMPQLIPISRFFDISQSGQYSFKVTLNSISPSSETVDLINTVIAVVGQSATYDALETISQGQTATFVYNVL